MCYCTKQPISVCIAHVHGLHTILSYVKVHIHTHLYLWTKVCSCMLVIFYAFDHCVIISFCHTACKHALHPHNGVHMYIQICQCSNDAISTSFEAKCSYKIFPAFTICVNALSGSPCFSLIVQPSVHLIYKSKPQRKEQLTHLLSDWALHLFNWRERPIGYWKHIYRTAVYLMRGFYMNPFRRHTQLMDSYRGPHNVICPCTTPWKMSSTHWDMEAAKVTQVSTKPCLLNVPDNIQSNALQTVQVWGKR